MPTASILRAQYLATELGIRHKHSYELDQDSFDAHVMLTDKALQVTTLLITTDKVKTKPWLRPLDYRLMEILWREKDFRGQYPNNFDCGKYKFKKNIEFNCLFSTPELTTPTSSSVRKAYWTALLNGFEVFYNRLNKTNDKSIVRFTRWRPRLPKGLNNSIPPTSQDRANSKDVLTARKKITNTFKDQNGNDYKAENIYTAVSLAAIHTEHSTRNAFISGLTGIMPLADIAALVGQKSIATTVHYNQVSIEKYSKYKNEMHNARVVQERQTVEDAFNADRQKAEQNFGFTSIDVYQDDGEGKTISGIRQDGVVVLRNASHERIAFTDTHICPYAMNCPPDIIKENGGYRMCGLCRAKVCSIDHLPAIAKKLEYTEFNLWEMFSEHQKKSAETGKNNTDLRKLYNDELINLAAWELAFQILEQKRQYLIQTDQNPAFNYTFKSNMLDADVQMVRGKCSLDELMFKSIEEIENYPTMAGDSPLLMKMARRLKGKLLAQMAKSQPDEIEKYMSEIINTDASESTLLQVSALIKTLISTRAITREQVIELLSNEREQYALPIKRTKSLLGLDNHAVRLMSLNKGLKD